MAVNTETALGLVKARLNMLSSNTSLDTYLQARISAEIDDLTANGITLNDSYGDLLLVVDMTVWRYQNRDNAGSMPDWLRLMRRERWLRQHALEANPDDS